MSTTPDTERRRHSSGAVRSGTRSRDHRRHGSRQRSSAVNDFGQPLRTSSQPFLVSATDCCLWLTVVAVALGFGGRAAVGQLALVVGALLTSSCWLLHQFISRETKYTWTGTECLWVAGMLVAGLQIAPLPAEWLHAISPQMRVILPTLFETGGPRPLPMEWNQLSLAPAETASGLATFAAYAMLFVVVAQRVRTLSDAERMVHGVALATAAMALFALVQYGASNDRFFWFINHPYMTTGRSTLGCFTNRNHLAQYLALGIGPFVGWVLIVLREGAPAEQDFSNRTLRRGLAFLVILGLGTTLFALSLSHSRGGILALGIALFVSFGLMYRMGLVSMRFMAGLVMTGIILVGAFFFVGHIELEDRLESTIEGQASEGRSDIWDANIKVARDFSWVGTGIGTHADAYYMHFAAIDYDHESSHAECGYLQVASESGLAGLVVTAAFILLSLWYASRGLWHPDIRARALAAAVMASLMANLVHAAFDFFWYAPSCMLSLAFQLAAVTRLARSVRQTDLSPDSDAIVTREFRIPRIITVVLASGLAAAGFWMLQQKIPATRAEPSQMQELYLSRNKMEMDEESVEEAGRLSLRAARLNPRDSRLQELAGMEYLRRFDVRQKVLPNPFPFVQVRDSIKASEFESREAMESWLQRAIGPNAKLLYAARRAFRRALIASPLRSISYVKLAELGILELGSDADELKLLKQALRLRPLDATILYEVGRNVMRSEDLEKGIGYWRTAFARSRTIRDTIIDPLVEREDPEFLLTNLKPDVEGLGLIGRAYERVGRKEEARQCWAKHVEEGAQSLKTELTWQQVERLVLSMREAYIALNETERAIAVLNVGLKRVPQSFLIHYRLASDLQSVHQYGEAAELLKWCAARQPDNLVLQEEAAMAVKRHLSSRVKTTTSG